MKVSGAAEGEGVGHDLGEGGGVSGVSSAPQKHIKEYHEEVRERPCPHPGCNKVFMIDRYLQRHLKLIHTGVCPPCTPPRAPYSLVELMCPARGPGEGVLAGPVLLCGPQRFGITSVMNVGRHSSNASIFWSTRCATREPNPCSKCVGPGPDRSSPWYPILPHLALSCPLTLPCPQV